ncbi:MAG TPA: folylpolyglutamate synthase/dihydrofolate synthase family protein [Blastocatellia bacterium]|nr:folylpolyglutamate synthase/dihydrofolate synthase family protein [Blastocatellia bacterium]
MKYTEAVNYLYSLGHETLAMKLELESIRALCHALGDPQKKFPAVHIAGTNGKGSTSAMVEAMTRASGLRVGLYTSPHLIEITERIRVEGRDITPEDFARLATHVRATSEQVVADGMLPAPPTFFEQVTAIAFLYFVEHKIDLAVLEVGLGGRLDATNICEPLVCAITPVSADHQQYLGHTLPSIAAEKAGIIKTAAPVVVSPQEPEAMGVIAEKCARMNAPLIECEAQKAECVIEEDGTCRFRYQTEVAGYDVKLNLRGRHQVINACAAIHIAEQLRRRGLRISTEAVVEGLQNVDWSGRLELIIQNNGPRILLDGAHNPAGARVLRDFLDEYCHAPVTLIFGVMSDKAVLEIAETLFPVAGTAIATHIDNPRATDPRVIAETVAGHGWDVRVTDSVAEALATALKATPPGGLVCACGSLYLIGEIQKLLKTGG